MTVQEFSIASGIEPDVINLMLARGLLHRDVDGVHRSELHAIARCNARMTQLRAVKKEVIAQRARLRELETKNPNLAGSEV